MRRSPSPLAALLSLAGVAFAPGSELRAAQKFDVLLRGGRVLDGSGNPFVHADVGIRGDTIEEVGDLRDATAARIVDAAGLYVTPGFIALHEHVEGDVLRGWGTLPNFTTQGFTTAVVNADGRNALWPIARQREEFERAGCALNLVTLVGHGTVRRRVMGEDFMRAASEEEIEAMKGLVRQGMEEGAFGLSTGLEYSPMRWSTEEEVVELAEVTARYGGHYQAHLRSQGQYPKWQLPSSPEKPVTNIDAVLETIEIAKRARLPVMMDHLHPKGPREWGSGRIITQLVDKAWEEGHRVYINQHPYEAYEENIVLVPRWALLPGPLRGLGQYDTDRPDADYSRLRENLAGRLQDPAQAKTIRGDIAYEIDRNGGPDGLLVLDYPDEAFVGKTLAAIAKERKEDPVDTAIHLQMSGFDRPGGGDFRAFAVSPIDIEEFMRKDYTGVCTDRRGDSPELRSGASPAGAIPRRPPVHPGTFGTAPRKIRVFVFEKKVVTLPFAIRSLTSLPAQILALRDRGRLEPGRKADVVVFDPGTIRDRATYLDPFQYSEGVRFVLVNGRFVVDEGRPTDAKPGRVLAPPRGGGR